MPVPALENKKVSVLGLVKDEKGEVVKDIDVDDVQNDDMYTNRCDKNVNIFKDFVDDNKITKAASPIKKELSLAQD